MGIRLLNQFENKRASMNWPFFIKRDRKEGNRKPFSHTHIGFEFGVVLQGSVYRLHQEKKYLCHPGDVFLINCSLLHGNRPYKNQAYEKILVYIEPFAMINLLPEMGDMRLMLPFFALDWGANPIIRLSEKIKNLLCQAYQECNTEQEDEGLRAWPLICSALVEIYLACKPSLSGHMDSQNFRRDSFRISLAMEYLQSNWNQKDSIKEIAKHCGLSESYFRSIFSRWMKISPLEYRNRLRINRAMEKMLQTDEKLEMIALDCGFGSYVQFTQMFQRFTGYSPKEFRTKKSISLNE